VRSEPDPEPEIEPEIEVSVLGPVEVRGAAFPFQRAWTLELVVYLALHPRGATNEAWADALWPDRVMAAPTLHSTVSAARHSLGRSRHGGDHLPRRNGVIRVGPGVSTDWRRFRSLAGSDEPSDWRRALSLVRGRPFEGLRGADWTVLEGLAAEIGSEAVAVAGRTARWALDRGDGALATWAARRGLRASPYDERLYRLLLMAADAEGNPAGVEGVMGELIRLLAGGEVPRHQGFGTEMVEDIEHFVHPDTAAVYRRLSRLRQPVAGRVLARL
jgi:hypothetical protein